LSLFAAYITACFRETGRFVAVVFPPVFINYRKWLRSVFWYFSLEQLRVPCFLHGGIQGRTLRGGTPELRDLVIYDVIAFYHFSECFLLLK